MAVRSIESGSPFFPQKENLPNGLSHSVFGKVRTMVENVSNRHPEKKPPSLKNAPDEQFAAYNDVLRTDNGLGRTLYNYADPESPSENDVLGPISRVLIDHGGTAPVSVIAEQTGKTPEEVYDLGNLKGVFEIQKNKEERDIFTAPPLEAFLKEKGLLESEE